MFVCLKGSQDKEKTPTFRLEFGGDKWGRAAVVCLSERLSKSQEKQKTNLSVGLGGDKWDRTADLLNAIVSINWITLFLGFF